MSGAERGPAASALRAGLAVVEPFYAAAAAARNRSYDRRPDRARRLPRPVISVGNITAGGTGKTPVVRWLAERLRERGRHVAILSRGYKAAPGTFGDEQRMLDAMLNGGAGRAAPGVRPGPRCACSPTPTATPPARRPLRQHPETDVILLDDGFQHRRLARDLDLVLIRATEPFGFGHVLPRGLLREPLAGLRRAGAFVLTHADAVTAGEREWIEGELRRRHPGAPIYAAVHAPVALRAAPVGSAGNDPARAGGGNVGTEVPLDRLAPARVFAFCGIGNPGGFERELRGLCRQYAGHRWFPDHHAYSAADLREVRSAAARAGADVLVTTEKDWVKLAPLADPALQGVGNGRAAGSQLPLWRLDVAAQFLGDDGPRLLDQIATILSAAGAS